MKNWVLFLSVLLFSISASAQNPPTYRDMYKKGLSHTTVKRSYNLPDETSFGNTVGDENSAEIRTQIALNSMEARVQAKYEEMKAASVSQEPTDAVKSGHVSTSKLYNDREKQESTLTVNQDLGLESQNEAVVDSLIAEEEKTSYASRTAQAENADEPQQSGGGLGGLMQQYEQSKKERAKLQSFKVKRSIPLP